MKKRNPFQNAFVSALTGGLVVAVAGLIAINGGLIEVESSDPAPASGTAMSDSRPAANPSRAGEASKTIGEIYADEGRGIAFIEARLGEQPAESPFGFPEERGGGVSSGSGFVIDREGKIMTNHHVVGSAEEIEVKLGDSETTYEAEVVGEDPATDLALIQVDAPPDALHPLQLAESADVEVGDPVVAIGNPFGLDRTVTSGIVSALQRQIQAPNGFAISDVIQTDAPINPGNSGGPLIDDSGEVIGINSQIQTGGLSGGNVGIGFAVPIDTARDVIEQIEETGSVEHAFLGITGATVDSSIADALNLPIESGVLVQEAPEDGPAAKAGIEAGDTSATLDGIDVRLGGDIIVEIDGEQVTSMDDVIAAVNEAEPGDTVQLTVVRDGEREQLEVRLGSRPEAAG